MKAMKLPSGNYRTVVIAGFDKNGKRIYKSFTAPEEWQAIKMAEDYKKKHVNPDAGGLTLKRAFNSYINTRSNVIEPTTVRNYRQIADHCFQCLMDEKVYSLTVIDIQNAVNKEAARVSPKYVKNAYGLLKSVLKMHDVDFKLDGIKLPKLQKQEKELPPFSSVYSGVRGTDSELPVLLAAWLSLRIGEVIGLQYRDVDMDKHRIYVKRTIIMTEEGYKVREGCKTEKSQRQLELPDYIYDMIMALPHTSDEDFIVPLTRKSLYSRFSRLIKKHDIEMTYHDLRHLNASIMLMLGVPDKYAMERGGWSTDNVLKSVYQQTFSSERRKIDKMIDGYFNGIVMHGDDINSISSSV